MTPPAAHQQPGHLPPVSGRVSQSGRVGTSERGIPWGRTVLCPVGPLPTSLASAQVKTKMSAGGANVPGWGEGRELEESSDCHPRMWPPRVLILN